MRSTIPSITTSTRLAWSASMLSSTCRSTSAMRLSISGVLITRTHRCRTCGKPSGTSRGRYSVLSQDHLRQADIRAEVAQVRETDDLWRIYSRGWVTVYTTDALDVSGSAEASQVFAERWQGRVRDDEWQV